MEFVTRHLLSIILLTPVAGPASSSGHPEPAPEDTLDVVEAELDRLLSADRDLLGEVEAWLAEDY
jgi:hypothetical protein